MTAQAAAGDFGYSEARLGEGRYAVTYTTPRLRVSLDADERARALDGEKERAHGLALWRAAQLALLEKYPALIVEQDRRDAIVTLRDEADTWPYREPYRYGPYGHPYWRPWPGYGGGYRSASARVTVRIEARFLKDTGAPGGFDAGATADRLAKLYGSTVY